MNFAKFAPIFVFALAVGILASQFIGDSFAGKSEWISFGLALLAGLFAWYLPQLKIPPGQGDKLSTWLIGGGLTCFLAGLALQFYLASISAANSQRAADIVEKSGANPQRFNELNIRTNYPKSVEVMGYLSVLLGIASVATGIRVQLGSAKDAPAETKE